MLCKITNWHLWLNKQKLEDIMKFVAIRVAIIVEFKQKVVNY